MSRNRKEHRLHRGRCVRQEKHHGSQYGHAALCRERHGGGGEPAAQQEHPAVSRHLAPYRRRTLFDHHQRQLRRGGDSGKDPTDVPLAQPPHRQCTATQHHPSRRGRGKLERLFQRISNQSQRRLRAARKRRGPTLAEGTYPLWTQGYGSLYRARPQPGL